MEDKKVVNTNLGILLICLFSAVFTMADFIIIDHVLDKYIDYSKCDVKDNGTVSGNTDNTPVIDDKKTDDSQVIENGISSQNNFNYLRDTELTAGCSNEINIKIDNGDIVISNGEKTVRYNGVDAKYIHWRGFMECGSVNLFYLTNDNNLFEINGLYNLFGDSNTRYVEPLKKADNVIEMLDDITSEDIYGDTHISSKGIKVLTSNNEVITVYWHSFLPPTGQESTLFSDN